MGKGRDNSGSLRQPRHLDIDLMDLLDAALGFPLSSTGANTGGPAKEESIKRFLLAMPSLGVALTHKSASLENLELIDNERLEFLGDSIIEARVSASLYLRYQDRDEGFLTMARAALVNTDALSQVANELAIDKFVVLGAGERASGGSRKRTILAGTFEAIIAAIFLDCGLDKACDAIERTVLFDLDNLDLDLGILDPKSQLQVFFAKAGREAPRYISEMTGPQHAPSFLVRVDVDGGHSYLGTGGSKKEAEQSAARAALEALTENSIGRA